jgi:hypothetical protein
MLKFTRHLQAFREIPVFWVWALTTVKKNGLESAFGTKKKHILKNS